MDKLGIQPLLFRRKNESICLLQILPKEEYHPVLTESYDHLIEQISSTV